MSSFNHSVSAHENDKASQSALHFHNQYEPLAAPVSPVLNRAAFLQGEKIACAYLTCEMNS